MSKLKDDKVLMQIKDLAGDYLARTSNRTSLITVTSVVMSSDMRRATIFLSVLPVEREHTVILFTNRHKNDFRDHIKAHSRIRFIPAVEFMVDEGEKNRQRISELLENEK